MTSQVQEARAASRPASSVERLALTAQRLFAEKGFDATTVEEIVAAAGVSRRTFSNYFESKDAAFWYQPGSGTNDLYERLRAVAGRPDLWLSVVEVMSDWSTELDQQARSYIVTRFRVIAGSPTLRQRMPDITRSTTAAIEHALGADLATGMERVLLSGAAASLAHTSRETVHAWAQGELSTPLPEALTRVLTPLATAFRAALEEVRVRP